MNKFSKIFSLLSKFIFAIGLTALITILLDVQGQKRLLFAERSYDSLNSTILSMLPTSSEENTDFDFDTKTSNADSKNTEELDVIIDVKSINNSEDFKEREVISHTSSENPKLSDIYQNEIIVDQKTIKEQVGDLYSKPIKIETPIVIKENLTTPPKFAFRIKEKHSVLIKSLSGANFKMNEETFKNLISTSISIAINNIELDEKDMRALKSGMADIEKNIAFLDMNLQDIRNMTAIVGILQSLEHKANRIGMELGALKVCNFHKPEFDINSNLEIISMKQTFECHPDIAAKIMKRIKLLPEWKKLSLKSRR